MRKKKILFLVQLPPPVHGASAVNKAIQSSTPINQSFETQYINISPASDLSDIGKINAKKLFYLLMILGRSITAYIKFKPDLVYITISPHGWAFYKDSIIAAITKLLGGKIVYHLHGKGIAATTEGSPLKKALYKLAFKGASIVHLAEPLFIDVSGVRDKSKPLLHVPNGIHQPKHPDTTQKEDTFTFIYLSNLVRTKGADLVIRAARLIPEEHQSKFQVKIIGKQSTQQYADELRELIASNPYKNIHLMPPKYGEEKNTHLQTSHVFILPTSNDCFPLAILEAMAANLAVISTSEGAIPEIIDHGTTGEIIEHPTPEEISTVMLKFIKTPEYTKKCAEAGHKKFTQNYTIEHFEKNLIQALSRIISENERAA